MTSKLYTLFFASILIGSAGCKTASKMYEKGNYDEAVELAAKKLQKDPNDQKLLNIIESSYAYAVNDHEARIKTQGQSMNELKWEWIYNEYVSLQKMYDAIYKVPAVYNLVRPTNYSSFELTYAEKAGDVRFDRGMALMEQSDRQSYKQAYREFQLALSFKPGDLSASQKMKEAYEEAVTNVVILPMQQNGGYVYSGYMPGANNLDDQIVRDLQFNTGNEFVRFYSAWDARSQHIRGDQQVELHLIDLKIGRVQQYRSTKRVSKDIVVKETVYKPDSVVKEYAKVVADVTTTRRTMASESLLQVTVRDFEDRRLWNNEFRAQHNWSNETSSYTGDARALSESDQQLINRKTGFPPSDREVSQYLLSQLNSEALYSIKNYFSRY